MRYDEQGFAHLEFHVDHPGDEYLMFQINNYRMIEIFNETLEGLKNNDVVGRAQDH